MKDLKIEYTDGRLVALSIDGKSLLHKAVQAIQFTHEHGSSPVFKVTLVEEINPPNEDVIVNEHKSAAAHNQVGSHNKRRK